MAQHAAASPELDPRLHAPLVRRALQGFGVPPDALDDAVQDVFVVLVRRADDFDRGRSLVNWLWGVARGVASTHRRSRVRRGRLHAALGQVERAEDLGPDELWARARAVELVAGFLDGLSVDQREVFVRSELRGSSGPELAAELGINLNTAYARLRAVRQRFEAELAAREGVVAKLLRLFAPLGLLAPKSVATAAIGASLMIAGVSLVPGAIAPPETDTDVEVAEVASSPGDDGQARADRSTRRARRSTPSPRVELEPANDEGMKTAILTTVALGTVLAQATPAEAREPRHKRAAQVSSDADADDAARVEGSGQTTAYDFENDYLTGEVLKPEGLPVDAKTRARFPSLLTIRGHFMLELITIAKDV